MVPADGRPAPAAQSRPLRPLCAARRGAAEVDAALTAGGRLVSEDRAPAFWVLADGEGNEACVTTWQGRDD
ncbi:VOC family protein [Streptomyces sp. SJL17-4]|uniref:VOC family protein n=1 Tax=Streptomyces sp. SJL17-4 TaxID=2967224 RepID=UPI0030CEC0D9